MSFTALRTVLRIHGVIFLFFPLIVWGMRSDWWGFSHLRRGWLWTPLHMKYEYMMVAIYFSLAIALLVAANSPRPLQHSLLFNYCVYGAYGAHGLVMLVEALYDWNKDWQHVMPWGDVTALFVLSATLFWAHRRAIAEESRGSK